MKTPVAIQTPSGKWRCQVCVNGKKYSITADTQRKAEAEAIGIKLSYKKMQKSSVTLSEAIDDYIRSRANILSPSTIRSYKSIQKHRFQSVMDKPLSNQTNWQKIVNDESKTLSPKTVKNVWSFISSVLKENDINVRVRLPQLVPNEHKFLQPEEIKTLIAAIHGHRYEMTYLLCLHGLRRSEASAVKKKNIRNGYIEVRGALVYDENSNLIERKQNKNVTSNRNVPIMIQRLNDLVSQCNTEYLCPYNISSTCHPLNTICRQNGLPEVGLHGLRHSYASLCYHLGLSEMQTMEYGGWSDPTVMRKIYTHLASADRKDAEEKLKSYFNP